MAVVLPLCYVGCHCLIRHNQRAHGLQDLTHLTVVILDSATAVLTKHQSADTVVRRVDTTVMVLHVVLRMVGIVDSRQTTVIVLVIDGLALLFEVGCLLGEHIAQSIVGKGGDTACRVIYLCATVAHIIDGCRYVALGVCYLDQSVDAIIFERSGNDTIRSAELLGLHRLATTIGIGCLTITQRISYSRYECIATCVRRVFRLGLSIVRKRYFHGTVKHVINRYGWRHVVKCLVESCLASHCFGYRVISLSHTTESVIDIASADNHHGLVFRSTTLGSCRYHTVFLHLNGTPEAVHEGYIRYHIYYLFL